MSGYNKNSDKQLENILLFLLGFVSGAFMMIISIALT